MQPVTVYLPIDLDSGPYCPPHCIGNLGNRKTCIVFWQDLTKARDAAGKPLRHATGFKYKKCGNCIRAVKKSMEAPPLPQKIITVKWYPPPDIFPPE